MLLARSANRKRSIALLVAFASLFAVSVLVLPSAIQPAHAAGPAFVQGAGEGTSFTDSYGTNVASGDLLVVAFQVAASDILASPTVSDSLSTSWTDAGTYCANTVGGACSTSTENLYASVYYGFAPSSGADAVTLSASGAALAGLTLLEFSGAGGAVQASTATGSGTTGTSLSTASLAFPSSDTILVASAAGYGSGYVTSAGTGFTRVNEGNEGGGASYAVSGVSSPTDFPMGQSVSVPWVDEGVAIYGTAVQPITATFASTYGGAAQTVTVSGCFTESPSTFTGNGGTSDITMNAACGFTLTLPAGYEWTPSDASTVTGTACSSGTCSAYSASYQQVPVTEAVTITPGESYSSADSASVTGCDPSVSSVAMDGLQHSFSAEPSATCTFTVTESGTAGYIFSGGALTAAHSTSASGTDTYSFTVYRQYYSTFEVTANAQSAFDTGMSWPVAITADGGASSCVISSTAAVSDSASCWSDYDQPTTIPQLASAPPANSRWASASACANTPTIGGNTYVCASYKQWAETWEATANAQTHFGANLQTVVQGTSIGVSGSTLCTITSTGGVATATCAAYIDNAQAATFSSSMSGSGSKVQWVCSTCTTAAQTAGGNTPNINYWKQVLNTFEATTNGAGPPTWDATLSITVTGTSRGVSGSTLCTLSPSSGTTTAPYCTVFSDFNAAVTEPAAASGSGTDIRWDVTGTSSWTPATGGNTYAGAYYKQLYNTYTMVPASPTTWDKAYTEPVTGTLFGASLSTVCSVSLASAGGSASCSGWSDYGTASGPPGSFNDGTTGAWAATGAYSFTETTGGNTLSVSYDDNGGAVTQPIEITVAASGPSGTFTLSGCQVSPTTVASDGAVHDVSAIGSCPITLTVPTDGATTRYRIGAGYSTTAGIATCAGSGITCTTASESSTQQDLVTLSNCVSPSLSPASPTGDMWYDYATASVDVTCNGTWSRSGGTGTRAISYNWDGGTNTVVLTTMTFTADSPEVVTGQTLNVNPSTQYFVTLDAGATAALSSCNPTVPGDGCWYDSGTTASIVVDGVFGRASGTGTRLASWQLDASGSVNALLTTMQTDIQIPSIAGPHSIYTVTVTQYQVVPSGGLTLSAPTISGDTGWYDANADVTVTGTGGSTTYVIDTPTWADQVSSYGLQLVTNDDPGSVTWGSLDLTFTCTPSCSVRVFIPSASGLSVEEVTGGGSAVSYSTQGAITSFSGATSTWEVYFGQTSGSQGSGGSSTTTTSSTSSTSTTTSGGLFQNSPWVSYIVIAVVVAAVVGVVGLILLKDKGGRDAVTGKIPLRWSDFD